MKINSILYTLLFGVAVTLFFGLAYPHHLHYQEQFQLFLFDSNYVCDVVKLPGGVADLLGRFCTQFFLYAWTGAIIIGVLLSLIQLLLLRLASWGRLYAMSFVPSCLLWLYLLDENALLGAVWAVLLTLVAAWAFAKLSVGWVRRVLLVAAIPVLYWMAGPVSVLFFLLQDRRADRAVWYYVPLALVLVMPLALQHFIPVPCKSLFFGIHYHRYPSQVPSLLWCAAFSACLLTLAVCALQKWVNAQCTIHNSQCTIHNAPIGHKLTMLSFSLVAICTGLLVWKNSNFKAEKTMQYDFMACHQQWNRILNTAEKEKPNNQIGVTVQNLAMAMRGELCEYMFAYNQNGLMGLLPDVDRDATSSLPTAEVYYQLGMVYAAQRTVFEAQEAILDFQKSARCYKRLAQTNLILGNYEVARKYLMTLQKTLYYSDWANETLQLLGNEEAINQHSEYGRLRKMGYKDDFYFSDHVTPQMLEGLFLSHTDNRMAYEYLMAAYLLTGDLEGFVNHVEWTNKLGYDSLPRSFQEALQLWWSFGNSQCEEMLPKVGANVVNRFEQFRRYCNTPAASPDGMAKEYGDTYWHYFFKITSR